MIYTIEEIKNTAIPIIEDYGIVRLSIFGSYARGEAKDGSDIDFLIDKGELKGLIQYCALVRKLEEAFGCHVDLITMGASDKEFLRRIQKRSLLYMNETDRKSIERIIYYCNRLQEHVLYFGDSREEFFNNKQYQDACSLVIIQIGEFVGRLSDEFRNQHPNIPWGDIKGMRNIHAHNYDNIMFDLVWESITDDFPHIKEYLEKLIY